MKTHASFPPETTPLFPLLIEVESPGFSHWEKGDRLICDTPDDLPVNVGFKVIETRFKIANLSGRAK